MVKRKRTLSTKENNESANQASDADQCSDAAKRLKAGGSPGVLEGGRPAELASRQPDHAHPPASSTVTSTVDGTVTASLPVSVGPSQSIPDVPLPQPSVIPQTRSVPQLRTSARVLNKQRREETKVDNVQTNVVGTRKSDVTGLESEYGDEEETLGSGGGNSKKRRRAWELWSMEDKDIFFESINECGKDFEAIQNYITTKLRKKGTPGFQIKNKDQVRHFYYRTWHKISKYITFHEGVKKATQELYGLINYGELRKKIGGTLDERKGQKLQELIRKGSTSVRVKGKSVRVRTPICRALKKLNQIEEHREHGELRVPLSITVEIVPASIHAWCHVQGQAHNPRVRVTTPLQRPLAALISHLQEKWRRSELKLRETLSSRATFPVNLEDVKEKVLRILPPKGTVIKPISVQPDVLMKSSAVSLLSHEARLRRRGEKIGRSNKRKENKQTLNKGPTEEIIIDEIAGEGEGPQCDAEGLGGDAEGPGCDVDGLGGDLEDLGGEVSQEELEDGSDVEVGGMNSPDGDQEEAVILSPDAPAGTTKSACGPMQVKEEPPDSPLMMSHGIIDSDIKVKEESEAESTEALRQLLALETVANAGTPENDADVVCVGESTRLTANVGEAQKSSANSSANQATSARNNGPLEEKGLDSPRPDEDEKDQKGDVTATPGEDTEAWMQKIQGGWTLSSVGGITIGELYLLFGQNKKLNLEYDFEEPVTEKLSESDESQTKSQEDSPSRGAISGIVNCDITKAATIASSNLPGAGMGAMLDMEREQRPDATGKETADNSRENANDKSKVDVGEAKRAAVENLSGMLVQLLSMARVIMAKSPTESCSCGHVCGRGGGGFRSPAATKGQGLLGLGRSPNSGRSPRSGRLGSTGGNSPNVRSPGMQQVIAGRSPLAAKTLKERNKPSSAKKLIPDVMGSGISKVDMTNGTSSSTSNGVEVTFLPPISSGAIPTTSTTSGSQDQGQMAGVRVVVGTGGDGGEFRVPVAPAPRQVHSQQASFNAQLNKFLPRYNNRPGRRVVRKNVVVQRQLPLLPKAVVPPPGVVTVKMLAPSPQDQTSSSFIPITIAPAPSGIPVSTGSLISSNLQPKVSPSLSSPTQPIRHQLLQPVQTSLINNKPPSPVQLPALTTRLPTALPSSTPCALGNAISVNVSGQPLLTVEMPTSASGAPVTVDTPSNSVERVEALPSTSRVDDTLSTTVNTVTNASHVNGLLNTIVSQALSELPDLSTPPGTPQPSNMNKSPNTGGHSTVTTVASCPRIPSPSLFNSSLSLDSLPSLSGGIMTNLPLVSNSSSSISPSLSSNVLTQSISSSLSPITKLLTTASTSHLELSPPPSQTNSFASLLNTPTPHSISNTPPIQVHNVSPTPPSLSALLSASSPPDMSRSFASLLSPHHENASAVTVPELHIPEGVVNLPLLDISLGGTVTLEDQAPSLLGESTTVTLGAEMPPVSTVSTVTSTYVRLTTSTSSMSGVNSLQETSSDKLLDITLGISNSNSSFSSLLAAATQPRSLDSALLGTPSLVSDSCGIATENNGDGGSVVEGISAVDISGFPALSTTPPSPPSSPSRLLQQSDNQWLNNEVNDFSLSSLLGHFESPVKGSSSRGSSQPASSGPMLPNLISVYNENSVDFTAKFAELKAQASEVYKQ
ncbi:serine-rich adhesin for platelets [Penaeus vannamei]|uniref:serine-rich adhesin for platelets n=1 Tax=Penaeus vannamei TaxID=6689 RepID=UPI00387F3DE2